MCIYLAYYTICMLIISDMCLHILKTPNKGVFSQITKTSWVFLHYKISKLFIIQKDTVWYKKIKFKYLNKH